MLLLQHLLIRQVRVNLRIGACSKVVFILDDEIDVPREVLVKAMKLWRHVCGYLKALREEVLDLCTTIVIHVALVVFAALFVIILVVDVVLNILILTRIVRKLGFIQVSLRLRVMMVSTELTAVVEPVMHSYLLAARRLEAATLSVLWPAILALTMLVS